MKNIKNKDAEFDYLNPKSGYSSNSKEDSNDLKDFLEYKTIGKPFNKVIMTTVLVLFTLILFISGFLVDRYSIQVQNQLSHFLPETMIRNPYKDYADCINGENEQSYPEHSSAMLIVCKNNDLNSILKTLENFENKFNRNFHYPWIFISEELLTKDFTAKVFEATSSDLIIAQIPKAYWNMPCGVNRRNMNSYMMERKSREHMMNRSRKSRGRMMGRSKDGCNDDKEENGMENFSPQMDRFLSGFLPKLDSLKDFKYIWNVKPGDELRCNLNFNPFKVMYDEEKIFGFAMTNLNTENAEDFWDESVSFFNQCETKPEKSSIGFVEYHEDEKRIINDKYNKCNYDSVFSVIDLDFLRTREYQDYFNYLDKTKNFFYQGWDPLSVRTVALSNLVPPEKIKYFENVGYSSNALELICPFGKEIYNELNCDCESSNIQNGSKCLPIFFHGLKV